MQYHGVVRHHDQWTHASTCGCEWDYDGQRYIDEVPTSLMFVFSVVLPVINLFYGRQRNMSSNTRCSGLSRQREYSTSRMASAFSRSKPH
ncbi:hypothetical protein TNCV_3197581 [Trichonephila clavipes]|nr:hypothetical protein TNCV_3197581 [Trichonephila clavipes]